MEQRKPKIFRAKHSEPGDFRLGYILLPCGYAYNADYSNAKKGDILRLFNGGDYRIFSVKKLKISSIECDILCRMRYGITIKGALSRWQMNAKLEGHGMRAVSEDECLWVVYEPDRL